MKELFTNNWVCFIAGGIVAGCCFIIYKDSPLTRIRDYTKLQTDMLQKFNRCFTALNFLAECLSQIDPDHDASYWVDYSFQIADKALNNANIQDKK